MSAKKFNTNRKPKPTHKQFIDLTSQRFGRLVVTGYAGVRGRKTRWFCQCDCGNTTEVFAFLLKNKQSQSCGCFSKQRVSETHTKHGEAANYKRSTEYSTYNDAKGRCRNPKNKAFELYGSRGIEFRFESFNDFLSAVGRKPAPEYTLDRIDVNGNYEKGNVRWATRKDQSLNLRKSHYVTHNGITKHISVWAQDLGLTKHAIRSRLRRSGWCESCAVTLGMDKRCIHKK